MAGKTKVPDPAPRVLTGREPHKYLAKIKPSIARNFSLTRADALYATVDLAWYLAALDRAKEARSLADHVADAVIFNGNQSIWSPASAAIVLAARLARRARAPRRARALIARLVENPAYADVPRHQLEATVAHNAAQIERARAETSQKWSCHVLSRALMGTAYFSETMGAGFYYDRWLDRAVLDRTIAEALALLRERLG